ncbi:MAG: MipA/OmpV family protein [Paraglaciecola sp.]|uniref:MipA/OmpV family protein n=1 Tax=Paraglaciecola sp. TaxID=1920173 RepID=UPI003297933E
MYKLLGYWFALVTLTVILGFTPGAVTAQTSNEDDSSNGGFMEASFAIAAFDSRFVDAPHHFGNVLNLRFNYQWNGFFIEDKGLKGLGLPGIGYNFYSDPAWSFDMYISEVHTSIRVDDSDTINNEQNGLIGINPRKSDNRFGLRATHYINETSALRLLIAPISDLEHHDTHLALWYGKTWQYFNANLYTTFSAQYDNSKTLNYYYGVSDSEASDKFPVYTAGSGITLGAEFGISYPLATDWVLESSIQFTRLPSSAHNSPIVDPKIESIAQISIVYVLF